MDSEIDSRRIVDNAPQQLRRARTAIEDVLPAVDGEGFVGVVLWINEDGADREVDVAIGETFNAGGYVWRLDRVGRVQDDRDLIGIPTLEAFVTLIEEA